MMEVFCGESYNTIYDPIPIESVVPELDRNWKDKKFYVWTRIWSKLASKRVKFHNVKKEQRLKFLEEALSDPQFEVNDWAAKELKGEGSEASIKILIAASNSSRNPGRYSAQKMIRLIAVKRAILSGQVEQ